MTADEIETQWRDWFNKDFRPAEKPDAANGFRFISSRHAVCGGEIAVSIIAWVDLKMGGKQASATLVLSDVENATQDLVKDGYDHASAQLRALLPPDIAEGVAA